MYTITKDFTFSASHRLQGLPPEHKCSRRHGHNYTIRIELSTSDLTSIGFVRDYSELAVVDDWLAVNWDHRDLNEMIDNVEPTAENLARLIWMKTREILTIRPEEHLAVAVSETPRTWARFSEGKS